MPIEWTIFITSVFRFIATVEVEDRMGSMIGSYACDTWPMKGQKVFISFLFCDWHCHQT